MTAADRREELEAAIWRERGGSRERGAADVDRILAAADAYAYASVRAYARSLTAEQLSAFPPERLRAALRLAKAAGENRRADAGRARKRAAS